MKKKIVNLKIKRVKSDIEYYSPDKDITLMKDGTVKANNIEGAKKIAAVLRKLMKEIKINQ